MKLTKLALAGISLALLATSCNKDDDSSTPEFTVNPTYTATNFDDASTQAAYNSWKDLSTEMKKADPSEPNEAVSSSDLTVIYNRGLQGITAPFQNDNFPIVAQSFDLTATPGIFDTPYDLETPSNSPSGGIAYKHFLVGTPPYGPYEPEQFIEKASYIGSAWNHVKNTIFANPSSVDKTALDAALVLYGSNPAFDQTKWAAKYSSSREDENGTYHDQINFQFRRAQSAIEQDNMAEKEAALAQITSLWEKAIVAQVIYYLEDGVVDKLAFEPDYNNTEQYNTVADAIHAWSEAAGFMIGFTSVEGTVISNAQITSVMAKFNADLTAFTFEPLLLINDQAQLNDVNAAADQLKGIYGLQ
jgi:hypothetical protein